MQLEDSGKLLLAFVILVSAVILCSLVGLLPHNNSGGVSPGQQGYHPTTTGWNASAMYTTPAVAPSAPMTTGGRAREIIAEVTAMQQARSGIAPASTTTPAGQSPILAQPLGRGTAFAAPMALQPPPVYVLPSQVALSPERTAVIEQRIRQAMQGGSSVPGIPASWKSLNTDGSLWLVSAAPDPNVSPEAHVAARGILAASHAVYPYRVTVYNAGSTPVRLLPHSITFSDGSSLRAFLCNSDWAYTAGSLPGQAYFTPALAPAPCATVAPGTQCTLCLYAEDGLRAGSNSVTGGSGTPQGVRLVQLPDSDPVMQVEPQTTADQRLLHLADALKNYDNSGQAVQFSL